MYEPMIQAFWEITNLSLALAKKGNSVKEKMIKGGGFGIWDAQ